MLLRLAAEPVNASKETFTSKQILEIKDEVGTCWLDLGKELGLNEARVRCLEKEYKVNRERAHQVLQMWIDQKGDDATVERLASTLTKIRHKGLADKLLGM